MQLDGVIIPQFHIFLLLDHRTKIQMYKFSASQVQVLPCNLVFQIQMEQSLLLSNYSTQFYLLELTQMSHMMELALL
jgi:hypothetical protein